MFLLFNRWNEVHIVEVYDVSNWIQFGRGCNDWKYKDLKLKWCRQRIWLWGKMGLQNFTSKLDLIVVICFIFVTSPESKSKNKFSFWKTMWLLLSYLSFCSSITREVKAIQAPLGKVPPNARRTKFWVAVRHIKPASILLKILTVILKCLNQIYI